MIYTIKNKNIYISNCVCVCVGGVYYIYIIKSFNKAFTFFVHKSVTCVIFFFTKQTIMTIINFYHDLQKTSTKMSFSVTLVNIPKILSWIFR